MSNYSLSVCLTDLQGAQVQANQNGKKFVFIPIEDADLVLTDKGKVYLNLNLWENRSGQPDQYNKTHYVKQNFSKERQEMYKASGQKTPYIGSGKPIVLKNQNNGYPQQQNQPVYQQTAPQGYAAPQADPFASTNNDMPF